MDPLCCKLGEKDHPGTCLARAKNFSISDESSSFHPRDDCVIEYYKCCYRAHEKGKNARMLYGYKIYLCLDHKNA